MVSAGADHDDPDERSYHPDMAGNKKNVVITGSTRGIGRGMAREFLQRGHRVVISGRSQQSVDRALDELRLVTNSADQLIGIPCKVADFDQVQNLCDQSLDRLGSIDIWINNAGVANSRAMIGELPADEIQSVPATNIVGTMNGAKIALAAMEKQGHGAIYNFEGLGSDGRTMPSMSLYGASKCAITYFTKCLIKETRDSPVLVGYMSPGIVLTHLAIGDYQSMPAERWEYIKKMYNILADREETVTPFLVEGVLANDKHGAKIAWLTRRKALWRFATARFSHRDLFADFDLNSVEPDHAA